MAGEGSGHPRLLRLQLPHHRPDHLHMHPGHVGGDLLALVLHEGHEVGQDLGVVQGPVAVHLPGLTREHVFRVWVLVVVKGRDLRSVGGREQGRGEAAGSGWACKLLSVVCALADALPVQVQSVHELKEDVLHRCEWA